MAEAIQKRWRFKLGLDEEIPVALDKVHPDDINYK
jgi:hypothetical protein